MDKARLVWGVGDGVPYITDPVAARGGVRIVFSSRLGGSSRGPFESLNLSTMVGDEEDAVRANRAALAEAAGFDPSGVALGKQVHGSTVLQVSGGAAEPVGECDAVVTGTAEVAVGVLTADCVPVLLTDGEAVAAVHAGWRGLVAGVIEAAAQRLGSVTAAWVGPSIHACCYEVGPEVVAAFRERGLPVAAPDRVDPGRAALVALRRVGVDNLAASDACTSCDDRFFSHRRDGMTGRQGAFIARRAGT